MRVAAAASFAARVLCAASLLIVSAAARGHAVVVESEPHHNAALARAPQRVVLKFNVRVEQALSRASLKSGNGRPVPLTPLRDGAAQSDRLVVLLPPLERGEHELRYRVLAADGHTTQGVLRFRVLP